MLIYIIKRLLRGLVVLFGVSIVIFGLLSVSGDPATIMLPPTASQSEVVDLRRSYGLDEPLHIQYGKFLSRAIRGDFGTSWMYRIPAGKLVLEHFPNTLQLALTALLIAVVIGIPVGIISATREGSIVDVLGLGVGIVGRSMPSFWLGIMLILVFAVTLGWLPTSGKGSIRNLVMPAITLSTGYLAQIVLLVRSGMLDVLREEYIRVAYAKGLRDRVVYLRHAFRNTLIPVVTMVGLSFGRMLGGSIVTETVFAWPGVGRLAVSAVGQRDYPLVQASVILISVWIILSNLVVDVLYAYIDPRIRYDE